MEQDMALAAPQVAWRSWKISAEEAFAFYCHEMEYSYARYGRLLGTPLDCFELWNDAVLQAQQWALDYVPLPYARVTFDGVLHYNGLGTPVTWTPKNDEDMAAAIRRVRWLIGPECTWFAPEWRYVWEKMLLPPLEADAARRLSKRANQEWRQRTLANQGVKSFAEIKALHDVATEVEAIAGPGRKLGQELIYRCPFHDDHHPSLNVNPAKGLWLCRVCGKGGDVVTLLKLLGRL